MKKSEVEISRQEELRRAKEAAKAARRQIHEQRRLANEAARASHRENCLEGMRQAGKLENEEEDDENPPQEEDEGVHQVSDDEEDELVEQKPGEKAAVSEGRISKRRNKKKKAGKKIAKKHPAYNYLTQKAESKLMCNKSIIWLVKKITKFLYCFSEEAGQTEPNNEEVQTSIVRLRKIVYNK